MREGLVLPTSACVGVSCTFDGPPVLSRGQADSVDAVHDALVVGDSPEGVFPGEVVGFEYLVSDS